MNKSFVTAIISLATIIFIAGCPPTPTPPTKPATIKPQQPTTESSKPKIEKSAATIFNEKCAPVLNEFVDDNGMVDYRILKRNQSQLKSLLNEFAELNPKEYDSWAEEDKIAFWLNAYNIQLLKTILSNYPIQASRIRLVFWPPKSIRHIQGIYTDHKFIIMDEQFTLSELEKKIFKKQFDEPRVFMAISQASISGPALRNEPYYGHSLQQQLDDQTKKFLSRTDAFKIDRQKKTVRLSAILNPNWYGKQFVSKYGTNKKFKDQPESVRAVLNFTTKYISKQDVNFLEIENYTVEFMKYNWVLNE